MTYHIKSSSKASFGTFFLYCYASPCFIHVTVSRPTDDRETVKAHRRVSSGHSRSKCAARVRRANGQPSKQVDRDNEYTSQVLLRLGFRWSEPDSDYVGKMLTAISQLGFFEV